MPSANNWLQEHNAIKKKSIFFITISKKNASKSMTYWHTKCVNAQEEKTVLIIPVQAYPEQLRHTGHPKEIYHQAVENK